MRQRGKYEKGYPWGAVVHFTAGRDGAQKTIDGGIGDGYTYLCIQKDGTIVQAHDVSQWGYHAGESKWPGLGSGVADKLIGIEINAAGRVEKQPDGRFKTWFGTYLEADQVRYTAGGDNQLKGYYEKYTPAQEASLIQVLLWLKGQAPDVFKFEYVLGHDEVAGMKGLGRWRKNDPGAALSMTMSDFRSALEAGWARQQGQVPEKETPVTPDAPKMTTRKENVIAAMSKRGYGAQAKKLVDFWVKSRPGSNPRNWAFVDFSLHESKKRLFMVDAETGVVDTHLVAHGSGSDKDRNGVPETFSNVDGSHQSSLGIYRVAETYQSSKFGYAARVDGLEASNSKARARAIVIHKADYVKNGGDTWGCFGLTSEDYRVIIDRLKDGSPLMAFTK